MSEIVGLTLEIILLIYLQLSSFVRNLLNIIMENLQLLVSGLPISNYPLSIFWIGFNFFIQLLAGVKICDESRPSLKHCNFKYLIQPDCTDFGIFTAELSVSLTSAQLIVIK